MYKFHLLTDIMKRSRATCVMTSKGAHLHFSGSGERLICERLQANAGAENAVTSWSAL